MARVNENHKNPDLSHLKKLDKPILGLDLDGVLSSTRECFIREIENKYNVKINQELHVNSNPVIPQIGKDFGTLIEEIIQYDSNIYKTMKPIKGSSKATNRLKEQYYIKIITHRVHENWFDKQKLDELKRLSINWLNENDIYFDEFVYPTPKNKSNVNANVYIDDRKNNIYDILNGNENNIGVLYLTPHNTESIPWKSWVASSEKQIDANYTANHDEEQWKIIADSFLNCLK